MNHAIARTLSQTTGQMISSGTNSPPALSRGINPVIVKQNPKISNLVCMMTHFWNNMFCFVVNMTMPSRRKATGSKGQRSGRQTVKPVNYSEDENDQDDSDVSESENDTNEEESVKTKGNFTLIITIRYPYKSPR